MKHAAERLRAAGAEVLGLNVFGHNAVARGLYDALGYRVVDQSFTLAVDRLSPR
jgi:ribosomal protein S18 acetylase RimI-like enzyme